MKVKYNEPIALLKGKLGKDIYARTLYGSTILQRCPKRTKPPTEAQLRARKAFAEKYAGKRAKVQE